MQVYVVCLSLPFYGKKKKTLSIPSLPKKKKKKPNEDWMDDLPYKELEEPLIDYLLVSIYLKRNLL